MKKNVLYIALIFLSTELSAQTMLWEKMIDYLPGQEVINSLDIAQDRNFLFCGTKGSIVYYAKADLNGDTLWMKKNLNISSCDNGEYIKQLKDGNIMHGGQQTFNSCTTSDFLFQKLDNNGNLISSWKYGKADGLNISDSFTEDPSGNFLGSGIYIDSNNDFIWSFMKLAPNGDSLWFKLFRIPYSSNSGSILINQKGNYLAYAFSTLPSAQFGHPCFVELSPEGDSLYSKCIIVKDSHVPEWFVPNAMVQTSDGNYALALRLDTMDALQNIVSVYGGLVLLDSTFNIKWSAVLRPPIGQSYITSKVVELRDSSFYVGVSPSNNQLVFYHISKNGQVLQKKIFTSSSCSSVVINEMKLLPDSSLIVSGACGDGENAYIARIGGVGLLPIIDTCKSFRTSFIIQQNQNSLQFINTSNGGYAYANQSEWKFSDSSISTVFSPKYFVTGTIDSVWARLIATNPYGCKDTISKKVKVISVPVTDTLPLSEENFKIIIYPNPASDFIDFKIVGENKNFKIIINNCLGQQVGSYELNLKEFKLSLTEYSAGMYFYKVTDEEGNNEHGKFVKE